MEKGDGLKPHPPGCCEAGEPKLGAVAPFQQLHGRGKGWWWGGSHATGRQNAAWSSGERPPPAPQAGEGRPPAHRASPERGAGAGGDRTQRLSALRRGAAPPPPPASLPPRSAPPRNGGGAAAPRSLTKNCSMAPACLLFPACLPGKSGGRRSLLFRVPARPHRRPRGEGCAKCRPPARTPWAAPRPAGPRAWQPLGGPRIGRPLSTAFWVRESG